MLDRRFEARPVKTPERLGSDRTEDNSSRYDRECHEEDD